MRAYELMVVFDPDLSSENRKKLISKLEKVVESEKGKVKKSKEWGMMKLAFVIKKKANGFFLFWELDLPEEKTSELDKKLRIEEGIIRYLFIKKE